MMKDASKSSGRHQWRIKDARGKSVTQVDPVTMHLVHQHDTISAEPLRVIAGEIGVGWSKASRTMFFIALACLVIVGLVFSIDAIHGLVTGKASLGTIFSRLTPMTGVWVGPFVIWMGATRIRFTRIRTVMLKHQRCPHCGYDLQELPVDPTDGATICPECGCAWDLVGAGAPDT